MVNDFTVGYPAWSDRDFSEPTRVNEAGKHAEMRAGYQAPTAIVSAGHVAGGRVIVADPRTQGAPNGHSRTDGGWSASSVQFGTLPDDTYTLLLDGESGSSFADLGLDPKFDAGKYRVLGVAIWNEYNMFRNAAGKTAGAFDYELIAEAREQRCGSTSDAVSYTLDRNTYGYACGDIVLGETLYFNTAITQAEIDDPENTVSLGGFNTDGVGQIFPYGRAKTSCVAGDTFVIDFSAPTNS